MLEASKLKDGEKTSVGRFSNDLTIALRISPNAVGG